MSHHARLAIDRPWRRRVQMLLIVALLAGCADRSLEPTPPLPAKPAAAARLPAAFHAAWERAHARALGPTTEVAGRMELGRLLHANGFPAAALELWQWLAAAQPKEARWVYYAAEAWRLQGDDPRAAELVRAAAAIDPNYAPAWQRVGDDAFKTGDLAGAEQAFARRLALLPDDPYARMGLARVAGQRGDSVAARAALEEILAQDATFSPAQTLLAAQLDAAGDVDGAARHRWLATTGRRYREPPDPWLEALTEFCFDASQLARRGAVDAQAGDLVKAEAAYRRAIALDPTDSEAYELLGRLCFEQNRLEEARDVLERGRQLPDPTEGMWADLSASYRLLQDASTAIQVAEAGLAQHPDSAVLLNALGQAQARQGDGEAAVASYRRALELDARAVDPAINLATWQLQRGDPAAAQETLGLALQRQPLHPQASVMLAHLQMDVGSLDAAGERLRRVFSTYPGANDVRAAMQRWYLQSSLAAAQAGDPSAALAQAERGLREFPQAAELHGLVGFVYAQQGRSEPAMQALERARQLQPADPRVVVTLVQLYLQQNRPADARRALEEAETHARAAGQTAAADQIAAYLERLQ